MSGLYYSDQSRVHDDERRAGRHALSYLEAEDVIVAGVRLATDFKFAWWGFHMITIVPGRSWVGKLYIKFQFKILSSSHGGSSKKKHFQT
jgi:hypothetical protein